MLNLGNILHFTPYILQGVLNIWKEGSLMLWMKQRSAAHHSLPRFLQKHLIWYHNVYLYDSTLYTCMISHCTLVWYHTVYLYDITSYTYIISHCILYDITLYICVISHRELYEDWGFRIRTWESSIEEWGLGTEDWGLRAGDGILEIQDWRLRTEDSFTRSGHQSLILKPQTSIHSPQSSIVKKGKNPRQLLLTTDATLHCPMYDSKDSC